MRLIVSSVIMAGVAIAAAVGAWQPSAPVPQAPPASQAASASDGPPRGLDLVPTFAEEFNGSAIDKGRWNLAYGPRTRGEAPVGSRTLWSNGEAQIYFDRDYLKLGIDPFRVADGILTISARPLPQAARDAVWGEVARTPGLLNGFKAPPRIEYSSGAITTRDLFRQRYGYFEIRAAWTGGKGVWPAFWLLPFDGAWPPEIDVVEAHGDKPGVAFQSTHSGRGPSVTKPATVAGSQADFHRYGALWQPDRIDFYVDGVLTSSAPEAPDMDKPMYLLANLGIGGFWPGYPDPDPNFSAQLRIDYIRAWQFRQPPSAGKPGAG